MERVYRVLLADDEPIILESLKVAIPWEQYGMEVVGEARNGKEALEAATKLAPDVIVSDIRMPVIDGISFMKQLRQGGSLLEPIFIVISGYGEFDYAREALRAGAFDYILKPIDHDELEQIIGKVKLQLDASKNKKLEEEQLIFSLKRLTSFAKERLYTEWVDGLPPSTLIQEEDEAEALQSPYCLFLVRLDRLQQVSERWQVEERRLWYFAINNVIQDFGAMHGSFTTFPYYSGEWILLFPEMSASDKYQLGKMLVHAIELCTKLSCSVGISSSALGLEQLRESYHSASLVLKEGFVRTEESVFVEGMIKDSSAISLRYPESIERELLEAIKTLDFDGVGQAMDHLLTHLHQPGSSKDRAIRIFFEMAIVARRELEMMIPSSEDAADQESLDILDSLEHAESLRGMIDLLHNRLKNWLQLAVDSRQGESGSNLINQAKRFIEVHYQEDIGIEEVAEFVQLSCSHFCTLFKQVTGSTFLEYVTKLRIEKAMFILQNSEVKVFQVAPLVGYQDPRYFTQVFKKVAGMTPTDYRLKHGSVSL